MSKGKILIVEPNDIIRDFLTNYLSDFGYEIHDVNYSSLQAFYYIFESFKPDLMLYAYEEINLNEPATWGIDEATHKIISLSHEKFISILFLVNKDRRIDWIGEHIGWMPDYFTKPVDIEELVLKISNDIESRHRYLANERDTNPDRQINHLV